MNARILSSIGVTALGIGMAASAILGPLALKVITFRTSHNIENQFVGSEIVSLGIVAPLAVASGVLWARGHRMGPVLALTSGLYAIYTYTSVVLGQEYGRYPGNVEHYFPLYAGMVALGGLVTWSAWTRVRNLLVTEPSVGIRRTLGWTFTGIGVLIGIAWAGQIRQIVSSHPSTEYLEGPATFWVIKFLDFGFLIPAAIVIEIGLIRNQPGAIKAAYGFGGFLACLTGSIAAMAVAMEVRNDPSAAPALIAILFPISVALAAGTIQLIRTTQPREAHSSNLVAAYDGV